HQFLGPRVVLNDDAELTGLDDDLRLAPAATLPLRRTFHRGGAVRRGGGNALPPWSGQPTASQQVAHELVRASLIRHAQPPVLDRSIAGHPAEQPRSLWT